MSQTAQRPENEILVGEELRLHRELAQETRNLIKGLHRWASDEDGVPEYMWDAYTQAGALLRKLGY